MRNVCWSLLLLCVCGLPAQAQELVEVVPANRSWARVESLLWRIKNDATPFPLVTTGTPGDPQAGVLGGPTTSVFFGNQLDYRWNAGAKIVLGRWLDDNQYFGIEINGFCLETHTIHGEFEANGQDGNPVIARPFFNLLTGKPDAQTLTSPQDALGGRYLGGIDIFGDSRTWGGEVNVLCGAADCGNWRLHALGGFRNLGQKDQLRFSQSSTVLIPGTVGFGGAPAPAPDIVSLQDYFETTNFYYGAQVGAQGQLSNGRWMLELVGKLGLGATDQRQEIGGHTLLTDSTGFTQNIPGGLYATPNILGHHQRWHFAWASEINVRAGFALMRWCQLDLGYTFLYWDGVVRPGRQLPLGVDPRQVPSNLAYVGAQPAAAAPFRSGDFWAQGLTLGLSFRF